MNSQTVLFIEPLEATRRIYATIIRPEQHGWELLFADDNRQAIELMQQTPTDVVVASGLAGRNGAELLTELKTAFPETIRFLMVDTSEQDQSKSLVGPAQQVLSYPLDPGHFTEQIDKALALRSLIQDPIIFGLIGDSETLPPLPRVFEKLSIRLNNPNVDLADVASIISQDVVLSAKVLRLVNSALFNLQSRVHHLAQAVPLLGTSTISSLVFTQGVYDTFQHPCIDEQFFEDLNRHSIVCAKTVEKILYKWGACQRMIDQAMFCCFAHDLGKLILARYAPEKWQQALEQITTHGDPDIEVEREIIGIGHAEVASYLLAIWGFSNDQVSAVAFHHDPLLGHQENKGTLCALHLAENCHPVDFQRGSADADYLAACGVSAEEMEECRALCEEIAARETETELEETPVDEPVEA